MDAQPLLRIDTLSKLYRIGGRPAREGKDGAKSPPFPLFRKKPDEGASTRDLWALKDVSLTVDRGCALGVIGRNGAGKTTLLKVLSRITEPTEGRIEGRGRIFPMLEVGASFHPEFSGRENVLLNAAMFGVTREEASERMDEIAAFAGVGDRLDEPVGNMTRGGYIRLAFSVAVNMRPDLLLADEVLAVGDAEFQALCLERIRAEKERGMTVLFVSHDMRAVSDICDQVAWLDGGRLRAIGDPDEIISNYERELLTSKARQVRTGASAGQAARLLSARLIGPSGEEVAEITQRDPLRLELVFAADVPGLTAAPGVDIYVDQVHLIHSAAEAPVALGGAGLYSAVVEFSPGTFTAREHMARFGLLIGAEGRPPAMLAKNVEVRFTIRGGSVHDPDGHQHRRDKAGLAGPKLKWSLAQGSTVGSEGTRTP